MYDELVKALRNMSKMGTKYGMAVVKMREAADAIEELSRKIESLESMREITPEAKYAIDKHADNIISHMDELIGCLENEPRWIPVTERLPECEQEVLICTEKKLVGKNAYIDSIVTPAIYEDGTMLENDSVWHWEDVDYVGWDEEEDCGIIPEGWWENRHFNPDEVYNNPVDRKVVAWMPLPEPPEEET